MFSQKELAPTEDQGFLFGIIQSAANSTIDQTRLFAKQLEDVYLSIPEHDSSFGVVFPTGGVGGIVTQPLYQRKRGVQHILLEAPTKSPKIAGGCVTQLLPPPLPRTPGVPRRLCLLSPAQRRALA